ncbi:MAG: glycosyltransferase family 1 protein [Nostocales cyanobacterium]|nr:MAG: glycosyltransferase family 1 protein [Nostocales cyanobacterium]TAF17836.1 MAG: glycosyltransferase family 1 protein [Nostocales cyanobacterium]
MKIIMLGASLQQNGGIATVENLILKHIPDEVKIHHITTHDEGSIFYRIRVFSLAILQFLWQIFTHKIDAVHIHVSDGGSLLRKAILAIISSLFSKPVVMHAHGAEFHVTYQKLPHWGQKLLGAIFQKSQGFIVLSETWRKYYIDTLGLSDQQVFVLPNPTELPERIPPRENTENINLVFCGRIGERKGAFDLIRAFAQLPEPYKQLANLILAGDGEVVKAKQLASELEISSQINCLGWVNSLQRELLLATANIFILPSYNEGLPMAILEAMGWGLPIITTPVGGIPELVVDHQNGLLVQPGNVQELSEAIALLINDEKLRRDLGATARNNIQPYDINNYCHRLVDIYYYLSKLHPNSSQSSKVEA